MSAAIRNRIPTISERSSGQEETLACTWTINRGGRATLWIVGRIQGVVNIDKF